MRPGLRWLLIGTVALSALALGWPGDPPVAPRVEAAVRELPLPGAQGPRAATAQLTQGVDALPAQLAAHTLEKSDFDPFAGMPPPAPPAPPALAALKPFIGPLYVPPPPPPTLNYRYLGQIVDPSGQRLVYLSRPDKEVTVAAGTRLDEGYVVETIERDGIRLRHPTLQTPVVIPIPAGRETSPLP